MKKSFLICLLAVLTLALATPPLQAANADSGKPGFSRLAEKGAKSKKKHRKFKKHAKRLKRNSASM
jgi:hypothetical protein